MLLDLTPALLHYLGFPVAKDMDGKVLEEIFEPEFLTEHPIRYVTTYEEPEAEQRQAEGTEAYSNLGVTFGNQGRLEEAVAMYREALELSPDDVEAPKAHNNLGVIHLGRGEVDEAMARFEQAVKGSLAHLESRYNLASIYVERDRVAEAIVLLEEATARAALGIYLGDPGISSRATLML